jgi:ligand-binding sensor domain-containing protein
MIALGCLLLAVSGQVPPAEFGELRTFFTTDDGLPQNSVTSLAQTPEGALWLGTYGGLTRFDGHHFSVFRSQPTQGPSSDRILALAVDAAGRLWVGTENAGLSILQGDQFTRLQVCDGRCSVLKIVCDAARIFILTDEGLYAGAADSELLQRLLAREGLSCSTRSKWAEPVRSGWLHSGHRWHH